jgi:hypothetical protein
MQTEPLPKISANVESEHPFLRSGVLPDRYGAVPSGSELATAK